MYRRKYYVIIIPIIGILISVLYLMDHGIAGRSDNWKYILHSIVLTSGLWSGCVCIVSYLWHKFPWERFPIKHLLIEIVSILLFTNIFAFTLYKIEIKLGIIQPTTSNIFIDIVITNLITIFITALHEAVAFYKQWKLHFSKSLRLEKDNIEAKYETLKAQINPHFLFNSLNSLTTLVDENERAVKYIQDLSEFLRYALKSRDRELVLVREEVKILKKYIALQKSRFRDNFIVELSIPEELYHYSVPPLVLQMLIENCIKHNIISKEKPLTVSIKSNKESLIVENNLQKKPNKDSTGLGLQNITERYSFFTSKEVRIVQSSDRFKVLVPLLLVEL